MNPPAKDQSSPVRDARIRRELSQLMLARRAGCSLGTVSITERGAPLSRAMAARFASVLSVSAESLLSPAHPPVAVPPKRRVAMIVAIDPGLRACGVALFTATGELDLARYVANRHVTRDVWPTAREASATARQVHDYITLAGERDPTALLLEMPRIYPRRQGKKDPNDLLGLAAVLGGICTLFPSVLVTEYEPHDWKKSLDGDAMTERIKGRLSPAEAGRIAPAIEAAKSKAHNLLDAVGIGLHYFGRLERKRVIAR
jgi:transcriptional regulator with XRE-family HTH domain